MKVVLTALLMHLPFFPKAKTDAPKPPMVVLAEEIEAAPAWPTMTDATLKTNGPKLLQVLSKVKGMKIEEVRKLVRHLGKNLKTDGKLNGGSKIFLLNRLYFNVPATEKVGEFSSYGGWVLPPYYDGLVDTLFPLQRNTDGTFAITGIFRGYMGAEYQYLKEFDAFALQYGIRADWH